MQKVLQMYTSHFRSSALKVTAALIVVRSRLFIGQRPAAKKFGLQWEFPGGKVQSGEKLEDSLAREIEEELCWHIRVDGLFRHLQHNYPDFTIDLFAYWCTIEKGSLCLKEHVAYSWVSLEELNNFDFTAADKQLVRYLQELNKLP